MGDRANARSLRAGLLEERYEVVEAIHTRPCELARELCDLLLQSVFHAQIAHDAGRFNFDDVAREISAKLVRRHPHVFGDMQLRRFARGAPEMG